MPPEHHPPHLVELGGGRAGERGVVHDGTDPGRPERAAVVDDRLDDLAKREHADQLAALHHDQRADVLLRHGVECGRERLVGRHGEERAALHAQDVADFHDRLR
jgi:hypothetical protein